MPVTVVTGETFRARFPEFASVADERVWLELEEAEADCDAGVFGDLLKRAIAFLAAHRIAISNDSGGSPTGSQPGAISAASADGVSSSYAIPEGLSGFDLALWSTVYGQRYMEIRNRCTAGPIVVC